MSGIHDILLNLEAAAAPETRVVSVVDRDDDESPSSSRAKRFAVRVAGSTGTKRQCREKTQKNEYNYNDELVFYRTAMNQCQEQDAKHKEWVDESIESVREVRRMYLYGLGKISKLQDLREAPDCVMPGNFGEKIEAVADVVQKGKEAKK